MTAPAPMPTRARPAIEIGITPAAPVKAKPELPEPEARPLDPPAGCGPEAKAAGEAEVTVKGTDSDTPRGEVSLTVKLPGPKPAVLNVNDTTPFTPTVLVPKEVPPGVTVAVTWSPGVSPEAVTVSEFPSTTVVALALTVGWLGG